MGVINFFRSIYKKKNLFISGNQVGKLLNVLKKVYKEVRLVRKRKYLQQIKYKYLSFL